MSFWNDPSQNATKSLLLIAIVALVGVGVYQLAGNNSSLTGSVFKGTQKTSQPLNLGTASSFSEDGTCSVAFCTDVTAKNQGSCIVLDGKTADSNKIDEKTCILDDQETIDEAIGASYTGAEVIILNER